MPREHPSLAQVFPRTEIAQILTRYIGRGIDRNGRAVGGLPTFAMLPEMVHGMQCRCGHRQKPEFDVQRSGHRQALLCGRGRVAIFEQHDGRPSLLRPDHREQVLMCGLIPLVRDQQGDRACPHIEGAVEHALGPITGAGDTHLLPPMPVATRQGWGFRNDRLIQHQDHRPRAVCEPAFEPHFACRHAGVRRAKA